MKVKYLVGPRKGQIVDMPTTSAKEGLAANPPTLELVDAGFVAGTRGLHSFGEGVLAKLHGREAVEPKPTRRKRRT